MIVFFTLALAASGLLLFFLSRIFSSGSNPWKKQGVLELKNDLGLIEFLSGKRSPPEQDRENYNFLKKRGEKYGGIIEFGTPLLLVRDLDLVKQIMVKDFDHFVDHRPFVDTDPLFSKSLFFLSGHEWKEIRSVLSPTFTTGKIKRMFHHFVSSGEKLISFIKTQPRPDGAYEYEIEVPTMMGRFTADVIGAVAFGLETDCLLENDSLFNKMAIRATDFNLKRVFKFSLIAFSKKIANFLNLQWLDPDVSTFFGDLLRQTFRHRKESGEHREDFLQMLLEARKENGDNLDDNVAVQQAFLFFVAGYDTVSNLLGESVYLLALNEDIQTKLYSEIDEYAKNGGGEISYEDASKMEYLEMFISEVLRMYAPIERLERRCIKKWKIPNTNVVLEEGTMVGVPATSIHYDPEYYENPETFERFSEANSKGRNPYTWIPFGTGPRNCIGMRLALIEAKVALSMIVYNFILRPTEGKTPIPMKVERPNGFLRPPKDLTITFIPRATHRPSIFSPRPSVQYSSRNSLIGNSLNLGDLHLRLNRRTSIFEADE